MISSKVKCLASCLFASLLLIGLVIVPLNGLLIGPLGGIVPPVYADASSATSSGNVVNNVSKWTRTGLPNNWEGGMVIGDVDNDGYNEIVYSGSGAVYVLDPLTGLNKYPPYIANDSSVGAIAQYCQPQLGDIDGDGQLEIVVPLYYHAGILILKVNTTSHILYKVWSALVQNPSAYGSCMSKPVMADIYGNGKMEVYIASQDVEPTGGTFESSGNLNGAFGGTITGFYYNGTQFAQTFAWRSCSGGLSIGDTEHDGQFEVFMGDRGMYMGDGDYGGGCRCFYANNLTQKWYNPDFLCSSQAPILADVNHDGKLEVIVSDQAIGEPSGGIHILNGSNGAFLEPKNGFNQGLPVHYELTVADVYGNGHLDALCNDGDYSQATYNGLYGAPDEMYVYDLTNFTVMNIISLGSPYNATTKKYNDPYNVSLAWNNKFSPLVANIYDNGNNPDGSPKMEIITGANTTIVGANSSSYPASILIFDNYGNLLQPPITGWSAQIGYPFVQDIDKDGKLELVVMNSAGKVAAYATNETAPSPSINSGLTFFGAYRTGEAIYYPMPWNADVGPIVAPVYPGSDGLAVPISLQNLSFQLSNHFGKTMNYWVTSSPNIGLGNGTASGGVYSVPIISGSLQPYKTYTWTVDATDGTIWNNETYSFKTAFAAPTGSPPTQSVPSLVPQDGGGNSFDNTFVCYNQSTFDSDGNKVTNLYKWYVNGTSIADVLMPFDTRNDTTAKDYSGYGNDGTIHGATWVPNGIVGGAYSFDGGNDYISVSDGGMGYYNNQTTNPGYPPYHATLGGDGTWSQITLENWIYMTKNTGSWLTVGKIPSYAIGFDRASQQLFGAIWVWNYDNTNETGPGSAFDQVYTSTTTYQVFSNTVLKLNTWYDIVLTYKSGDGLRLYINGTLDSSLTSYTSGYSNTSSPVNGTIERSSGNPLYIGGYGVGYFQGLIDDVGVYPYAFSPQEVQDLYQNSKGGTSSSSSTVPAGVGATAGSTLRCQVIPSDSQQDGTSSMSNGTLLTSGFNYTLSVTTVGSGSVSLNNTGPYEYGDVVQLTAVPDNPGWSFSFWSGNLTGSANPAILTMTGNMSVTATFVRNTYTLSINTIGQGIVNLSNNGPYYNYDDVVLLTAVPDSGWNFQSWNGSLSGSANPATLTMTVNESVTVTFTQYLFADGFDSGSFGAWTNTYADSGQTSTVESGTVHTGAYAAQFTTATSNERAYCYETLPGLSTIYARFYVDFNANPTSNYHVFVLRDDAGNNVANFQFVAGTQTKVRLYLYAGPSTYDANFNYTSNTWYCVEVMLVRGSTNGNATVWINGNQIVNAVNVKTDTGSTFGQFRFGHYYDDAGTIFIDSVVINTNYIGPEPTNVSIYNLYLTIVGSGSVSLNYTGPYHYGDVVQLTAVPATNWTFLNWTGDVIGTQNPTTVTMNANKTVTATFAQVSAVNYTLTVNVVGNGTVTQNPLSTTYPSGTVVTLNATPASGWIFQNWTGDVTGTQNPTNITMNSNKTVNAAFTQVYTLTVNVVGNGKVSESPAAASYPSGTVVTLNATPASGWSFSFWSGNLTGSANPATLTMTSSMSVTATFTQLPYLFSEGFDSGGFGMLTGTYTDSGQTSIVQNNVSESGGFAAQFTTTTSNERAYCYENLSGLSTVDVRFYVSFGSMPASSYTVFLMRDSAGNNVANFQFVAGTQTKVRLYLYAGPTTYNANFNFTINTWYCVEVMLQRGTANGNATVWINGTQMINAVNVKTDTGSTFGQFRFGHYYDSAGTIYIDSVIIDTKYIGP